MNGSDLSDTNHVAVVTASTSGIGLEVAKLLFKAGYCVILNGRDPDRLKNAIKNVSETRVHPSQWLGGVISDLTSENVIDSIWEILEKRSGQLKAVFINTPSPAMALPEEVTATQWSYAFQSLVRFPDEMLRRACQTMSLTGGGVVVVNSSCSARIPIDEEFYLSNTLRMVSVAQARAFARRYVNKGVRINVLLTGFTDTALTRSLAGTLSEQTGQNMKDIWSFWESAIPSRRLARPEEIAQVAAFLFSEHSSYINGAAIEVDGGLSMLNSNI